CTKETLPGASSLQRRSKKQRCISKTKWESRSASARTWSVGLRANSVTVSVLKAIKLKMRACPVKPRRRRERANPRFEPQEYHQPSTTGQGQAATTHLMR